MEALVQDEKYVVRQHLSEQFLRVGQVLTPNLNPNPDPNPNPNPNPEPEPGPGPEPEPEPEPEQFLA